MLDAAMAAFEGFDWQVAMTPSESNRMLKNAAHTPGKLGIEDLKAAGFIPEAVMESLEKAELALQGVELSCMDAVAQDKTNGH